jgi:hypothetical protein
MAGRPESPGFQLQRPRLQKADKDALSLNLSITALEEFCAYYNVYRTETGRFFKAPADQYRGAMRDDSDELVDQFVDLTINGELHDGQPAS